MMDGIKKSGKATLYAVLLPRKQAVKDYRAGPPHGKIAGY
jgi:hypothetical protein